METLRCIKYRRSVRKYKKKKIEDRVLARILEAGIWAPSSGNLSTTRFIVVEDEDKKKKVAQACLNQKWMTDAAAIIVVCSLTKPLARAYGKRGKEQYSIQNTATASQNIMLAAASLGLGTAWVGAFSESKIKRVLGIPDDVRVYNVIVLGYPKSTPSAPVRLQTYYVSFFNDWGNTSR